MDAVRCDVCPSGRGPTARSQTHAHIKNRNFVINVNGGCRCTSEATEENSSASHRLYFLNLYHYKKTFKITRIRSYCMHSSVKKSLMHPENSRRLGWICVHHLFAKMSLYNIELKSLKSLLHFRNIL